MELDLFQDVMETLLFFKLSGCTFRGSNSTTSIFVSQWGSTFKERNLLPRSKFFSLRVDPILEGGSKSIKCKQEVSQYYYSPLKQDMSAYRIAGLTKPSQSHKKILT